MSVAPAAWALVAGLCIFALVLPISHQFTNRQLSYDTTGVQTGLAVPSYGGGLRV